MEIIRDKNQRITPQRLMVLRELRKVCTHPTASELYLLVKNRTPNISLATIYRSLEFLEKKGLILKLESNTKEARYDGDVSKHCHLICKKCGAVMDIFDAKKITIQSDELRKSGFLPHLDFLEISGICKKCH
tara:strand:- start:539 stop:934 length:396 start_codon:yes stop_codon:yes gene_type:complete